MNSGTFDDLPLRDKKLIVDEFSDLLTSIEHYDDRIYLYSLNGHFVELYQNIDNQQIHRISIASYRDMDKYLSRLIIGDLWKKMRY